MNRDLACHSPVPTSRSKDRCCKGQTLVEFGLVLPLILLLLLAVLDFGRGVSAYLALAHSAREGARAGIYTSTTDNEIRDTVRRQALMLGDLPESKIIISPAFPRSSGDELQVTVTYDFDAVTPLVSAFWGGGALGMSSSARVKVE